MAEVYRYSELWTGLQAAGGAIVCRFLGLDHRRVRKLTGDHTRSFRVPKDHAQAAAFTKGRVIRDILSADGATWQEWVIDRVGRASGTELTFTVECISPMMLLANYPITTTDADGFVYRDTPAFQLAPSTIFASFIRSNTPSWMTGGTVTPTALAEVPFSGDSALSGIRRMEELLPDYEASFEPNGTSEYRMHFTALGSTADTLYLRSAKNILAMRKEVVPGQITRLTQITGAAGDDGPSGIAWAYWEVVSTSGSGPYRVKLKASHGGDGPIAFDGQLSHANLPGGANSLYLAKHGGGYVQITGSWGGATQEVEVASLTGITAGDWVRIVASSTGKHFTMLDAPTEMAAVGVLGGRFESGWDDTTCVVKNSLQEAWSGTRPDNWTGGVGSKTTTAGEWLTSGAALSVNTSISDGSQICAPPSRSWYIRARKTTYSATAWVRLRAAGAIALQVKVNGVVVGVPLIYESPLNAWRQLKLEGLDLSAYVGTSVTLLVEIVGVGSGTKNLLVDSICLTDSLSARGVTTGSNAARTWQQANDFLSVQRSEQVSYTGTVADLDTMGRANQQPLVIGGAAVVDDDDLGTVTTRVVQISDTPGDPRSAEVVLATLPPRFSRAQSKPLELVIPFFEPVAVQSASRDSRNAAQLLKAEITASDETSVTVSLTSLDSLGATPVISYSVFGATYVSGSGAGPYVFNKPATGTGLGRAVFTQKTPGRADVYDAVDIPEAEPPVLLTITATQTAADDDTMTFDVVAVDPKGTATITIVDDGGSATTGPSGDSWVIDRPDEGDPPLAVKFTASATNRTSQSVTITVPSKASVSGGTVPPSIDAFYSPSVDTGADEIDLAWEVSNETSPTFDLLFNWKVIETDGTITDEGNDSRTSISSPYGLAIAGCDLVTKGTSGWAYLIVTMTLLMKQSSVVVASRDISVTTYTVYTP